MFNFNFANAIVSFSTRGFQQVMGQVGAVRKSLVGLSAAGATAGAAVGGGLLGAGGIAVGFGAAMRAGGRFEFALARLGAISQASGNDLLALAASAREFGQSSVFSANQASEAMIRLSQAGLAPAEIIAAMPAVTNFAAAGMMDLNEAAEQAARMLNATGMEAEELTRLVDVLTKASNESTAEVSDFAVSMKYVAPIARQLGMEVERTAATLGILADAGMVADQGGTGLARVLARLSGRAPQAKAKIDDLVGSLKDADGQLLPLPTIIDKFNAALSRFAPADRTALVGQIFGDRGATAFLNLLDAGGDKLRDFEKELSGAGGNSAAIAAAQMDTLNGSLALLGNSFVDLGISISNIFGPALKSTVDWIKGAVDELSFFVDNFGVFFGIAFEHVRIFGDNAFNAIRALFQNMGIGAQWMFDNWKSIFITLGSFTATVLDNIGTNLINFFYAVQSWLQGDGFNFEWTGLTEGFVSAITEMPEFVKAATKDTSAELEAFYELLAQKEAKHVLDRTTKEKAKQITVDGEFAELGGGKAKSQQFGIADLARNIQKAAADKKMEKLAEKQANALANIDRNGVKVKNPEDLRGGAMFA